jgi:tetratricopeptide (TPR) repeat protein
MNSRWKLLACCVLCLWEGGIASVCAQTVSVSRTHIASDPAEVALSNLLVAAQTAIDSKDYQTAAQDYQDYLAKKPGEALVHFQLGYTYTAMQKADAAKTEYEEAISLDPKMSAAYLNLGLTLLTTDPGAAIAPLQKAVELSPGQPEPKYLLGTALERSGQLAPAIEQYEGAEKLDDKNPDLHVALGRTLLTTNRPIDAEPQFRAALLLRQDLSLAHLGLAESLASQNKLEAASMEYTIYLTTQPRDNPVRIEYASLLVGLGKYDDALSDLDQAASSGPEGLRALQLRSEVYFQKKRYDETVQTLQKAAVLAPQDPDIPALMGHAYLEKRDYPDAVKELTVASKMSPNANDVLENLVMAQFGSKNYQAALDALDLLSRRTTLSLTAWFVRAACYDKLGLAAQALDAYKKFLGMNTDQNSDMYFEAAARARFLTRQLQNK